MEEWRSVIGYEGLYEVSNLVRIRNTRTGMILKQKRDKDGYHEVGLYKDGKQKWFRVHRLVYETFCGKIPEGMVIDHCDGNPQNNRLDNLRCVTPKENNWNPATRPRHINGIKKRSKSQEWQKNVADACRKRCIKTVAQIDKQTGKIIKYWESAADARRSLGVSNHSISRCCSGKLKSAGGFRWQYA